MAIVYNPCNFCSDSANAISRTFCCKMGNNNGYFLKHCHRIGMKTQSDHQKLPCYFFYDWDSRLHHLNICFRMKCNPWESKQLFFTKGKFTQKTVLNNILKLYDTAMGILDNLKGKKFQKSNQFFQYDLKIFHLHYLYF